MANGDLLTTCPICAMDLEIAAPVNVRGAEIVHVACKNCGTHPLSFEVCHDMPQYPLTKAQRASLAHRVRKFGPQTLITWDRLFSLDRDAPLPGAMERIDNLVNYMASELQPGETIDIPIHFLRARLGCMDTQGVSWVLDQAVELGLLTPAQMRAHALTAKGWQHHEALMKSGAGSRHAFMAMKFSPEMWQVFTDHMCPAVAQTGFELRPVAGPHQAAGSIDDRMRVEIRTSRFMVCDLSDGNQGAYWEAGFAEGIGRKVLYTCRSDVLDGSHPTVRVHFDTAHQLIIKWDPADPSKGMQDLKNAIRATLPDEARMED